MAVVLKSPEDMERMRIAGRLASEVLDFITPHVRPGVTTGMLNDLCHDHMVKVQGTVPAPLNYAPPGYRPFPKSICTSVNHQVCHGVPGERVLKAGDILNVDITVIKDGYHGDCSRMFYVGEPSIQAKRLVDVTFECMWLGIRQVRPGARLGDIGAVDDKFQPTRRTRQRLVPEPRDQRLLGRRCHRISADQRHIDIAAPRLVGVQRH